jgi:endonuclease-3 related protein
VVKGVLMSVASEQLNEIYQKCFAHFGPQKWWPADSAFEVCVGAILVQNTSWANAAKAIANLKNAGLLTFEAMSAAQDPVIATLILPAGHFNLKTKRLRNFFNAVHNTFGNFDTLFSLPLHDLREKLSAINGIGPETADAMLLYAFERPVFVVDAYAKRILVRHNLIDADADYYRLQEFFQDHLEADAPHFNEFHALLVATGNKYCKRTRPKCDECPLKDVNGGPCLVEI